MIYEHDEEPLMAFMGPTTSGWAMTGVILLNPTRTPPTSRSSGTTRTEPRDPEMPSIWLAVQLGNDETSSKPTA
jgi:hypothetical protein